MLYEHSRRRNPVEIRIVINQLNTNQMKKILLFALPLLAMCFASCEKNEMIIIGYSFGKYDLWSSYQRDLYGDPYPAFGKEEELYGEYGIQCTFHGVNLYSTSGFDAVWSVSCDADWCHYESEVINPFIDSQGINSRLRINLTIDENTSGEIRYAEINLTCNGNPSSITITQYGTPTVTVSTPGTLTQELANKDLLYASSLKISGRLNDKDLETIKGLSKVETLDLTEAIITDLPDEMFFQNNTIKRIKLPETITTIHSKTFTFSSLEYIYFPASIETIEDGERHSNDYSWDNYGAFANTNLTSIEFAPQSKLKYIGICAFSGAGKRSDFEYNYPKYHYNFETVFPASLETVADYAFSHNSRGSYPNYESRMPTVKIGFEEGSKLKSFGRTHLLYSISIDAGNCTMVDYVGNLDADYVSMSIGTQTPPESDGVNSNASSYLYVPKECVGVYYDAAGWKQFKRIREIGQ